MDHVDQVNRLAALLPGHHPACCTPVNFHNPKTPALCRQYGLMVLSRSPVLSVRSWSLPQTTVQGQFRDPSILTECVIGHPERRFRRCVTHLNSVSPRARLRQAKTILSIVAEAVVEYPLINGPGAPDSDFAAD